MIMIIDILEKHKLTKKLSKNVSFKHFFYCLNTYTRLLDQYLVGTKILMTTQTPLRFG